METVSNGKKAIALGFIAILLTTLSFSNSNAASIGSFNHNKYNVENAVNDTSASANALLAAAAFGIGFVAGLGAGLVAGWAAAGELVDAIGAELASSFDSINYDSSDLSKFDAS